MECTRKADPGPQRIFLDKRKRPFPFQRGELHTRMTAKYKTCRRGSAMRDWVRNPVCIQDRNFRPPPCECATCQTSAHRRVCRPPEIAGESQFPPPNRQHFHRVTRLHTGNSRNAILEATVCQMPDIRSASAGNTTSLPESHGCTIVYHASGPHSGYPQNVFLAFFLVINFSTALRKPAIFH